MFTKFKGIFSSKQSSGEADEYFGSRNEKKKSLFITVCSGLNSIPSSKFTST